MYSPHTLVQIIPCSLLSLTKLDTYIPYISNVLHQLDDGLRKLMNVTQNLWESAGSFLTYCGGSRNRRNGIFSGVTDIQGMDM